MPLEEFSHFENDYELFFKTVFPRLYNNLHKWQREYVTRFTKSLSDTENNCVIKEAIGGVKGCGKTLISSTIALFMMLTKDNTIVSPCAGTKEQVITACFARLKELVYQESTTLSNYLVVGDLRCKYSDPAMGHAFNSEIKALILPKNIKDLSSTSGRHAKNEVLLIDEADLQSEEMIDHLLATRGSEQTIFFMLANPEIESSTRPLSFCGTIISSKQLGKSTQGWNVTTVKLDDCDKLNPAIIKDLKIQYGYPETNTPRYKKFVEGIYSVSDSSDILFSKQDLIDCSVRDNHPPVFKNELGCFGIDVAHGKGRNYSVISYLYGDQVFVLLFDNGISVTKLKNKILDLYKDAYRCPIYIDNYGAGASIYEELKEYIPNIYKVDLSQSENLREFENKQIRLYQNVSMLIKRKLIKIRFNPYTIGAERNLLKETDHIQVDYTVKGKRTVYNKQRTSHTSPDVMDSITYCFAGLTQEEFLKYYRKLLYKKRLVNP